MEVGVNEAAKKLNVNAYQVGPATPDPAQQVKVIEDLIAKNVDAIIVVPKRCQSVGARAEESTGKRHCGADA